MTDQSALDEWTLPVLEELMRHWVDAQEAAQGEASSPIASTPRAAMNDLSRREAEGRGAGRAPRRTRTFPFEGHSNSGNADDLIPADGQSILSWAQALEKANAW